MLKYRVITAIILLPLVVFGVLYTSTEVFALTVALVVSIAGWEWSALSGIKSFVARLTYTAILPIACFLVFNSSAMTSYVDIVMLVASICWLLLALFIMLDPVRQLGEVSKPLYGLLCSVSGLLLLLVMWWAFVSIQRLAGGPYLLLGMFVLVWAADSGAYFAGKKWGRHKLAPRVSPGKTWEGVVGGITLALLVAAFTPYILELTNPGMVDYIIIAAITVSISIYGDLLESVIKRVAGVKDSGRILPGHGGILDRIDSLIAAAPIYLSGLLLLGKAV